MNSQQTAEQRFDALLAMISDPEAFKQRRAELKAAEDAAREAQDKVDNRHAEATKAQANAAEMLKAADGLRAEAERKVADALAQDTKNGERADALNEYEKSLRAREAALRQAQAKMTDRENAVLHRENTIGEREQAAAKAKKEADVMKADLAARLKRMADAASGA